MKYALWQMIYLADRKNYKVLSGLLKEVVNFNQLVNHIYVFEQLQAAGYAGLRLGPRILRTETAGIAAIAALQVILGDLG